jgi:uncharacterized surface protein with fasciclin (FAS1) repeats
LNGFQTIIKKTMKKYSKISILLVLMGFALNGCKEELGPGETVDYTDTVKSKIDSDPRFSMFKELYTYVDALTNAGKTGNIAVGTTFPVFSGTLGTPNITAFIPTNDAFTSNGISSILVSGKLNPVFMSFLSRDTAASNIQNLTIIRNFVSYYLHNRVVEQSSFADNFTIKTLAGATVDSAYIRKKGSDYFANGYAKIDVSGGVSAKNGRLYAINNLLTPVYNGNLLQLVRIDTTLSLFNLALTRAADASIAAAANTVTSFTTTFAPTNQAFLEAGLNAAAINAATPAALAAIVRHHIVTRRLFTTDMTDGGLTMLSGTNVTVTTGAKTTIKAANTADAATVLGNNINCVRGVLYKIDKVLRP